MKSAVPKVMHRVCGLPIVHYGVKAALDAGCNDVVVVVGYGRSLVEDYVARAFAGRQVRTAVQDHPRGTGDAALAGLATIGKEALEVLVMNGDAPLVTGEHLRMVMSPVVRASSPAALSFATCLPADPTGYGRVLRKEGQVTEVREHRDLQSDDERSIREINAGIYVANIALLREALATLAPDNAQGELYITDIVAFSSNAGEHIATVALEADVLAGVNDRDQLVEVERTMYRRIARKWRIEGATVRPGACVDAGVILEHDCTVENGVALRGATRVESGAMVDVGCVLTDVVVGAGAVVKPYSVATASRIGPRAQVGPFAHLRPGSDIGEEAHVGNFVEAKNTKMGRGAKANHLAYLGDGVIGDAANVGAGTIFCNYDGVQKHTTIIEGGAFIGSDSQLVAPVTVGANAYVATGTTVTRDVPANALAISRVRQENKEGYASKLRARMKAAKDAKGK
jgi:bifunctional UDP-N-acetylglucosamine pyrophosphorylase/glucosamine-1-phosphate N-acetyltransferase